MEREYLPFMDEKAIEQVCVRVSSAHAAISLKVKKRDKTIDPIHDSTGLV